ncbi:MAG TPA: cell filamentation protein Fic, partial [Clostridia bacterium]|nr:cell filamentation protein Fic [Clostridia bacterium]
MYENQINDLHQKLTVLPPLSKSSLERLMQEFMVSYTYNSNAIEGSTLTERETYLVLNDGLGISGKELR